MLILVAMCIQFVDDILAMPTHKSIEDNKLHIYNFEFVTRTQWQAREPSATCPLATPVPYVVIHHTYIPSACYNFDECSQAMRSMQNYHMDDHSWNDIGYNFAVGSDGAVYEGRGWEKLGAHALHFNTVSIGIALIGDWTKILPSFKQLQAAKSLVNAGVELGYIKDNYKLVGHRQVRDTICPGDALYKEIQHWPHYSPHPSSVNELADVKELSDNIPNVTGT